MIGYSTSYFNEIFYIEIVAVHREMMISFGSTCAYHPEALCSIP